MGIAKYRILYFPLVAIEGRFGNAIVSPVVFQLDHRIAVLIFHTLSFFIQIPNLEGINLILFILAFNDRIAIVARNDITIRIHPGILNDSFFLIDQGHEAKIRLLCENRQEEMEYEDEGQQEAEGLFHE